MNRYKKYLLNKYIPLCLFLTALKLTELSAQHSIVEYQYFQSTILGQKVNYSLILPENYYKTVDKYPVIYLLHGIGGDGLSWINRCNFNFLVDSLKENNRIADFIYILPDARNSYYIDNYDNSFCYERFFIDELVPYIDSLYRTKPSSINRTIMGLSMGGFGAVILGIKHPDTFGTVISMSGALRDSLSFMNLSQDKYKQYFFNVFGPNLEPQSRITQHWKNNSPYILIDTTSDKQLKAINWYFDCGSEDFLYRDNENLHHHLLKYHIPHEFHSRPGMHNWEYWYISSANALIYNTYILHKKTVLNALP